MTKLAVATRKGLFLMEPSGDGWAIADPHFPGMQVTMVAADKAGLTMLAAIDEGHFGVKLHRSTDGGAHWTEVAAPSFPAVEEGEGDGPSVSLVWSLEPDADGSLERVWAGTIPAALFRSDDQGDSWSLVDGFWRIPERAEWFGGGFDQAGIHSICVDPRDRDTVAIAISSGGVWQSADGGETWEATCDGLWAAYVPPERRHDPAMQDPHRVVRCATQPDVAWMQHHNGMFRSADGLRNWSQIDEVPVSDFGFAVAVHPSDAETAWFAPAVADTARFPKDGVLVVTRTRDGGASFDVLNDGLPQQNAYDLIYRHGLDVAADGKTLALGSTTGGLWASSDAGDHWQAISLNLPPIYAVRFL